MKQEFSTKWKASKQPRKQRKFRANAPLHIRRKMLSANLSKELRKKYGRRNFPVIKGDTVRVLRGEFRGKTGKIDIVNYKKISVTVEGIYRTKKDGTKILIKINPSNLQIKELNLDDIKRKDSIERKITFSEKKERKTAENRIEKEKVEDKKEIKLKKLPKQN